LSAARDHDPEHIVELFAGFGPVSVRRMFSGAGIFAGGVMIGLISRGVIYLKADTSTIPDFEEEGLGPFTYQTKTGQRALASIGGCRTGSMTRRTNSPSGRGAPTPRRFMQAKSLRAHKRNAGPCARRSSGRKSNAVSGDLGFVA
jgi:hypothetical protein